MDCIVHASLVAQRVKHLPAMQETQVRSLGWGDPLEKEMASILQYSCLENPMDRGAWQATVHGVAKSQTRLSDVTFTFTIVFFRYHTSTSMLELFLILHYFIETS